MKLVFEKEDFTNNILIFWAILIQIILMIVEIPGESFIIVSLAVIQYFFISNHLGEKHTRFLLLYLLAVVVFAYLSYKYNGNMNLMGVLSNIALYSTVILLFNTKIFSIFPKLIFWIITVYFTYVFIMYKDFDRAFSGISRNYISVVYIFVICYLVLSCEQRQEKVKTVYMFLPLIFSILAVGRGGIISTAFMFAMYMLVQSFGEKSGKKRFLYRFVTLLLLLLICILLGNQNIINRLLSRFISIGIFDEARSNIWTHYMRMLYSNTNHVIFGAPIDNDWYLAMFISNLHNSFLSMHSRFGIIYTFINVMLITYSAIWYAKKGKWLMFIMILSLVIRGMTDAVFGPYWGDVFMWFYMLYPLIEKKKMKKNAINENQMFV